jgi:S-adenosylmethionine decarboxylase
MDPVSFMNTAQTHLAAAESEPALPESAEPEPAVRGVGTGTEWVVDASGCSAELLRDLGLIQRICQRVIADIGVEVVGEPQCHRFDGPGGVTALYMLSESHLACHTYPEYGLATFNLYCCRERAAWDWPGRLAETLRAQSVDVRQLSRGASGGLSACQQGGHDFSDRGQG